MRDAVSDDDLIERIRGRDERAIAELFLRYQPRIASMALRYLRNREDAEEVVQDVLVKVCQKIPEFRGEAALSSWIYRISFNTVMSRLRAARTSMHEKVEHRRRESNRLRDDAPQREAADTADLADVRVLRRQMRARLVVALGALPPMYRVPVILRDVQGLSTEQASRRLRLNDETLKSRLHRGRLMLRRTLADLAGISDRRMA